MDPGQRNQHGGFRTDRSRRHCRARVGIVTVHGGKTMKDQIDFDGQTRAPKRGLSRAARTGESRAGRRSLLRGFRALLCGESEGSALIEIALVLPMLLA